MKQQRKLPGILIYLLILFFSVIGYVYALHASVLENHKQVTSMGGSNSTNDGVEVSKTIEETDLENYFDITLKVTTQTKIDEILTDQDLAIVIVMDISNTMVTGKVTSGDTRLKAAQEAATELIYSFAGYSNGVKAARKIGFVSFNTDSQEIFSLQDCNTENQASILNNDMLTKTNKIVTTKDKYNQAYKDSYTRFTNIESGLKRASDMLDKSGIQNKYIIFLSDGLPTTYLNTDTTDNKYDGWNPYMSKYQNQNPDFDNTKNYTESIDGVFYNELAGKLSEDGTSYSDRGAIRARQMANSIKSSGTTIFSVGVGIKSDTEILIDKTSYVTDVDKETYEANGNKFETGLTGADFKNWLKNSIGSGYYYDTNSSTALKEAYAQIFEKVKQMTEESAQATWVAEDPMGVDGDVESIEFVGFFDDNQNLQNELADKYEDKTDNPTQSDTASITSGNKINWDLKNSSYTTTTSEDGKTTYYNYSIKYRVRLENELTKFKTTTIYDTNGVTKLTYVTRNNGVLSGNKTVEFPIPSVVGYLGELEFIKKNASFDDIASGVLEGAEFKLTHASDCPCMTVSKTNHKHMSETKTYTATSGTDGKVKFTNIPSGHKYILKESKAPEHFDATTNEYPVEVAYGVTTGGPSNGIVENKIQRGKLKISKEVQGNKDYAGEFEFKVTLTYKTTTLTGKYNYKIFNSSEKEISSGEISLTNGKFKLKDGEYIVIYGLPIGSKYTIEELTTNGYTVKHKINDKDVTNGATATCSSTDCDINNGGTQTVNFYNIAGYILPATGDSGMLILVIIASLLLIGPIIDIGYMFYKNRKEDKLTS